ncbi:S9 family peptidase [Pseudonocardia eucalypti]|uniref:S9 family peptidase n=1 Tax=Pseudonocardia eucalypti TaxID=648755 RepID=A0ABP9RDB9_9PSEU|nr:dipeptidyl aminopeptidase/acylaminoacyl peptidase [Pseudonocardia eucalypti]
MTGTPQSRDSGEIPSAIALDALTAADGRLYWIERRASGDVLVTWHNGRTGSVLPPGIHVASTVHEYGGGAYVVHDRVVWFVHADDQRIWRADGGALTPLTPEVTDGEHRHGDLHLSPDNRRLVCVRERHTGAEVINELVSLPADRPGQPQVIASGADFYSSPAIDSTGTKLAWITWNAPNMPWDGTRLWTADLRPDATIGPTALVGGSADEAISQPRYSPDGVLYFLSDRTGWANLYRHRDGHVEPVIACEAELGPAMWEFGYASYQPLPDQRVAVTAQEGPRTWLALTDSDGALVQLPVSYTSFKPYLAIDGHHLAAIGATPTQTPAVAVIDIRTGAHRELTTPIHSPHATPDKSPELIQFPTRDNSHAHAVLHPPTTAARGLLVRAHPGPTSNTHLRLDPWVLFFTSHGYAVLDVDYRGSTGYGRTYRNALRHRWGRIDVTDCIHAVTHLTKSGRVDPNRVAICGSSAGAYTALRALATTDIFRAGCVRHAVIDPATWAHTAPKFQAHHATLLTPPQSPDRLSPASAPIHLIHGENDTVTPINDVREFAAQQPHATLITYTDEAHGLRHPAHITHALHAELAHLKRHLKH